MITRDYSESKQIMHVVDLGVFQKKPTCWIYLRKNTPVKRQYLKSVQNHSEVSK